MLVQVLPAFFFFLLTVIHSLRSKPVLDLVCTLGRKPGEKCGEDKCDNDGMVRGVALLSLYIRSVHKVMPSFPGTRSSTLHSPDFYLKEH